MPDRVVVVGDINTDIVVHSPVPLADTAVGTDTASRIALSGGGSAANTAVWLAYAGVPVTLVGAVGQDAEGAARLAELGAAGVRCAVARVTGNTGAIVVLSDPGERTMLCDRGANQLLPVSYVDGAIRAAGAAHLHLSAYPLFDADSRPAARAALATARELGMTISVDAASAGPLAENPDFATWVRGVDLLLANADEAEVLGDAVRDIAGTLVTKRGRAGASLANADGVVEVPAIPAEVVDPTGAGDAFAAGFLSAWLSGTDRRTALVAATEYGARAVTALGARPR